MPNMPLQPTHSAVTPRAVARGAPTGEPLNGGVRRRFRSGLLIWLSVLSLACPRDGSQVATRAAATPASMSANAIMETFRRAHPDALRVGGDVQAPYLPVPIHPAWEKLAGNTGKAEFYLVEIVVDEKGKVVDSAFLRGGDQQIRQLILAAMRQWEYTPAQKGGKPVQCVLDVAFGVH